MPPKVKPEAAILVVPLGGEGELKPLPFSARSPIPETGEESGAESGEGEMQSENNHISESDELPKSASVAAGVSASGSDAHSGHSIGRAVADPVADPVATAGVVKNGHSQPRIAKKPITASVVSLSAERAKRIKTQRHSIATRGQSPIATRGQDGLRKAQPRVAIGKAYIEAVGASVGTMAFRLRWRENGKRQLPIYVSRVSMEVYEMIKGGDYEAFKQQLVSSHSASPVRASHTA